MNIWCKVTTIFILAALVAHPSAAHANPSTPMDIPLAQPPKAWLTRPWTGDDAPFLRIEEEIRGKRRAGASPQAIVSEERANAMKHQLDFAPQFRWLFASTLAADESDNVDYRAMEAVARADPGTFRAVARIRFAAGVLIDQNESHPDLDRVGERLLRASPNDRWVREHLIYDLARGRPSLPKAQTLAQAYVDSEPKNPQAHSALAFVYQLLWAAPDHRRVYAEKAIREYQAFLRLAPPNDSFRPHAHYFVNGFTKRLAGSP